MLIAHNMRPLIFVWPYALIFWVAFLWAFSAEFGIINRGRRNAAQQASKDSGSLRLIMFGQWVGLMIAIPFAFGTLFRAPASFAVPLFWAGTVTIVAGSVLRRHCFRQLGQYFTGDVQAQRDQPVIDRGAYRWVRHPSYTAGILMFSGIGVALGNWASLLVLLLSCSSVYAYRIRVEERALIAALGEPYVIFMKSRKRLIPFVI